MIFNNLPNWKTLKEKRYRWYSNLAIQNRVQLKFLGLYLVVGSFWGPHIFCAPPIKTHTHTHTLKQSFIDTAHLTYPLRWGWTFDPTIVNPLQYVLLTKSFLKWKDEGRGCACQELRASCRDPLGTDDHSSSPANSAPLPAILRAGWQMAVGEASKNSGDSLLRLLRRHVAEKYPTQWHGIERINCIFIIRNILYEIIWQYRKYIELLINGRIQKCRTTHFHFPSSWFNSSLSHFHFPFFYLPNCHQPFDKLTLPSDKAIALNESTRQNLTSSPRVVEFGGSPWSGNPVNTGDWGDVERGFLGEYLGSFWEF